MGPKKYQFAEVPYSRQQRIDDQVSITNRGRFGLTKSFAAEHGISSGTHVRLLWDSDNKAIFLAFVAGNPDGSYPVVFTKHGGAYVGARKFFEATGLRLAELVGHYKCAQVTAQDIGLTDVGDRIFVIQLPGSELPPAG